jgi:hypothetical protein
MIRTGAHDPEQTIAASWNRSRVVSSTSSVKSDFKVGSLPVLWRHVEQAELLLESAHQSDGCFDVIIRVQRRPARRLHPL